MAARGMYDRIAAEGAPPVLSMLNRIDRKVLDVAERLAPFLNGKLMLALLMAVGAALRLRQYMALISLGNDEAALARNIVERSFGGLTQPLSFEQGAPVLFLFIQKAFILVFGNRDFILELFPLLCGLVALYFFYRIARRHFGLAGLLAVFAFAISLWLIQYSADLKQYSSDVLVVVLLVDLADRCLAPQARGRDFLLLGVAGALGIWLSHPAAFVLPGIGLAVAISQLRRKDRRAIAWTLGMGGAWAVAFGLDYIVALRHLAADPYFEKYWAGSFMPLPPWRHPAWFADAYRALMLPVASRTDLLTLLSWSLLIVLGIVSLIAVQRSFSVMLLLPCALTLAASALHKYPVRDRLLLFLVPFMYLFAAEGLRRVYLSIAKWRVTPALLGSAVLLALILRPEIVSVKRNFVAPPRPWDMRAVVEYMSARWNEGDRVYVSGGGETFQYYATSYGLQPAALRVDNGHRIARYFNYVQDLQAYVGKDRVWIVFANFDTHSKLSNKKSARYEKYLNRVGLIQDRYRAGYARVYLCKFDP